MKKGKVYFIGAGPGEPDLITVRGHRVLEEADVIIYDYLLDKRILQYANKGEELICCDTLSKNEESRSPESRQERINRLLVKKAKAGKKVVRLKSGDPFIFGRCAQELEAMVREKIEFEVIPGVTAASAAASFSGIPLTNGALASSCVFVTGQENSSKKESLMDWKSLSKIGTIVFYMAVGNLKTITQRLIEVGKNPLTSAAIIEKASLPSQKVLCGTLKDIARKAKDRDIKPPAIVMIGETVGWGERFNWFKKTRRILFTGLSPERFFLKGRYEHIPLIKIEPLEDYREFDSYLKNISGFDWIVFTSRYGVEHFFNRLKALGYGSREIAGVRIAVIGDSTRRRLWDCAVKADLVPKNESSKGLIEAFKKVDLKDKKIFLPRSDISDKGLKKALEKMKARVTSSVAYRNVMPQDLPDIKLDEFDEIMFTSPSTVRNFIKRYKKIPSRVRVSCIGDVTQKEAGK